MRNFASGIELELNGSNTDEVVSRLGRDTRAGLWTVVCTMGSPSESHPDVLKAAEEHCDKVVIQQASA